MADEGVNLSPADYEAHLIKLYVKEPGVDTLDLSHAGLGMEQVEGILESLFNSQVTDLNLERNSLRDGMERLAELLVKTKIKTLNVSNCELSHTDMVHLTKILKNGQITGLDISFNKFEPDMSLMEEFTSCLVSSKITHLNISGILQHKDRPPMFRVLFSSLPGTAVEELHVANNYLCPTELQVLGQSLRDSKVEVLNLSHNYFRNDGLNALIPGLVNSRVSKLNLSDNQISDLRNLGKCFKDTQIKSLDLTGLYLINQVGFFASQSLEYLCLEELRLSAYSSDEVTLELARNLKVLEVNRAMFYSKKETVFEFPSVVRFSNISDISFTFCQLPVEALYNFGECLPGSKLTCISLRNCFHNWRDEEQEEHEAVLGVAMAAFLEKTKGSCVKSLDISENSLGEVGANIIAPKLVQTTFFHFDLSYCGIGSSVLNIVTNLKFTSITHLNLSNNSIGDAGAISLAKHLKETQVNELNLSQNEITREGAKALAAHLKDTKLLSVDLSLNKIDRYGLKALALRAENTLITQLDVSDNPGTRYINPSIIIRNVLWKNRASVQPFIHTFKLIAPTGTDNSLEFDRSADTADIDGFVDKVLTLYEFSVKKPQFVNILTKERDISLSKSEILTLMLDEFPKQFSFFVSRSIEADLSQHMCLLKRVEDSGLTVLVESLLLNRPTYIINEEQGILHPYVYTLLDKYKQPLYNLSIEPGFKTKLIDYFTKHGDLEYASDVVDLLRKK